MRRLIESTIVSLDGVIEAPAMPKYVAWRSLTETAWNGTSRFDDTLVRAGLLTGLSRGRTGLAEPASLRQSLELMTPLSARE